MKTQNLTKLELFSGCGGFHKGFIKAGYTFKKVIYSEVDKHAIANYKYNFKEAIYAGPVQEIKGANLSKIDIITFGSPCQDFSVAGKGEGLDGDRSSLIREAIRIITECRPSVFIWENVKGAYSSNQGRDFQAILQALTNIGGYRLEWQLLNTDWFLPQNRERIYLVGHIAGGSTRGVFPISKNDRLFNFQTKSEKGQPQTKRSTTIGTKNLRASDTYVSVPNTAACLTGGGNSGGLHSQMTQIKVGTLRTYKDGSGFRQIKSGKCPTIPARARNDGSGMPCVQVQVTLGKNQIAKNNDSNLSLNGSNQHGVYISTNTKSEEILLTENDSVDYSRPSSKTRRGVVGKGKTKTLDTFCRIAVLQINRIRRLTEIECERLQGFPDDWTKYGIYEQKKWIDRKKGTYEIVEIVKEIAKTQRFKIIGNAVTTDVVEAIAIKIKG